MRPARIGASGFLFFRATRTARAREGVRLSTRAHATGIHALYGERMPTQQKRTGASEVRVLEGPLHTEWLCGVTAFSWVAVTVAGVLGALGERPSGLALLLCVTLPFALHFALRGRFAVRFDDAGLTVVRPWGLRRVAWWQVTGVGFRRLPVGEDDVERWAVTVTAGARKLPLVTVDDSAEPSRDVLERHGRLFAPLAERGLRPEGEREQDYFARAVGSLSVG